MAYGATAQVEGLRELNRAFARSPKTLKREWRASQRKLAEPTRRAAEHKALTRIRRMGQSVDWAGMRVGITTNVVYVAPKKRGIKSGPRKRPNLAPLLAVRAMEPALYENEAQIMRDLDKLLGTVGRDWER
jgi:hypothetical protein